MPNCYLRDRFVYPYLTLFNYRVFSRHLELLAQGGHYSDMWQHQLSTPGGEQGEISEENVAKTEIYKHKL